MASALDHAAALARAGFDDVGWNLVDVAGPVPVALLRARRPAGDPPSWA